MDIALLQTFLAVARSRHFGKAAETLFVTQSAVSARIKLLESTLNVDLFTRKRNDIQLTPAGHKLKRRAETIVKGWEQARRELALDAGYSRCFAVGSVLDLWDVLVREWIVELRRERPELALQVDIQTGDTLVQRLNNGLLDVAFVFEPPQAPDLAVIQIRDVRLILVCSRPGIGVEEALRQGYIAVDWGTPFELRQAELFPAAPVCAVRVSIGRLALDLLRQPGGSAYLPEPVVRDAIDQGALFAVEDAPVIERHSYALYRLGSEARDLLIHLRQNGA